MIVGRPPFQGATPLETLELVRNQEPVPPTRLQPRTPTDLETICLKALQKDPARRFPDAGAMAEDLRRFLDGEPIVARPVGTPERLWRWCRRNPRVAVLAAAVVLMGIAITAGSVAFAASLKALNAELAESYKKEEQAKRDAQASERAAILAKNDAIAATERRGRRPREGAAGPREGRGAGRRGRSPRTATPWRRNASSASCSIRGSLSIPGTQALREELINTTLTGLDGRSVFIDLLGATLWAAISINVEDIERIEVVRGPGSALYGADAFNGVINIITKTPGTGGSGFNAGYGELNNTHGDHLVARARGRHGLPPLGGLRVHRLAGAGRSRTRRSSRPRCPTRTCR